MLAERKFNLIRDLVIIVLSIIIAVFLAETGILLNLLAIIRPFKILSCFLAGFFFISIFTAAPAAVVLIGLAQMNSALEVAVFGALGALVGDFIIFRFIKNTIAEDILYLVEKAKLEKLSAVFKLRIFSWLIPFLGALVVASPFPDELGLAMMGLAKMKTSLFIPLSFILNFLGIFVIGLVAKGLLSS